MNHLNKAQASQTQVVNFLKANGFTLAEVNSPSSNGIDIVAIKNNEHLLIEVKSVIKGTRGYRVKKIHPKSDYVAVIMPNNYIHFEAAYDWGRLTDTNGNRSITKLVQLYELLEYND